MDFTNLPRRNKTYAGANGSKISVLLDGEQYMLKFPAIPSINREISYTNGCISEYLGSQIFNLVGISSQETILGTFTKNNKKKIVVECKDFTTSETILQDFASLKNTIIDSEHNGYGTEITDILQAIDEQQAIDSYELKKHFWNMFIVDAFIGNWDRHNGNWGFLYNTRTDEMKIAPIYDCGSCLFPQADSEIMQLTLDNKEERDIRIFKIPTSGIKQKGQKINYYDFISSLEYSDCNDALKRMLPKIDMNKINSLINNTPYITDLQKTFYITMLRERKEKILDKSLQILKKREQNKR